MRGRLGGGEIRVFDSGRQQLIDRERDPASERLAPIVGDCSGEVFGGGERSDAAAGLPGIAGPLGGQLRGDQQRPAAKRAAVRLEFLAALERRAGDVLGRRLAPLRSAARSPRRAARGSAAR